MIPWLVACHHAVELPPLAAGDPRWPSAPDAPRVAWVGEIRLAGLDRPTDVACDAHTLAAVDPDRGVVQVIDLDRARAVRTTGGPRAAVAVSIDERGGLWTVDPERATGYHLSAKARRWEPFPLAGLVRPTAVVPLDDQHQIVVDTGGHQLHLRTAGAVSPIGPGRGEIGAGFNFPLDVAVTAHGWWVLDGLNAAVQSMDPQTGAVTLLAGGSGIGGDRLVRPKGVAVDGRGRLHVVDGGMQHVQVYAPHTHQLLGRYGRPGDGPGELALPGGLCIVGDAVYVADSLNHRIQVFLLLGEEP